MLDVQCIGPSAQSGPLPAVFYFALSAHDSLHVDPFNQPVLALQSSEIRIFSVTLPGHALLPPTIAFQHWTDELKKGHNPIDPFIDEVAAYIKTLTDQKIITSCAVMGLSRGVFIAAHVAAKLECIPMILGFAPLTKLDSILEFHGLDVKKWDLTNLSEKLYSKTIRCYIGNRDTRIGTDNCFLWLEKIAATAFEHGIRTSPIELIIGPSIGKDGHGTSPETFTAGAAWLLGQLKGPK